MSSKMKPWLVLSVIFIVGIVTGSALTVGLAPHFVQPPPPHAPEPTEIKSHWLAYLTRRLNLTADQKAKIDPIVADATARLQALQHKEVEADSQIFKAANDQIVALLTPEQKVEMQKMESEREKMFSGHMRPGGPPHDGSGEMHHHGGTNENGAPPPPPPPPTPAASTNTAPLS